MSRISLEARSLGLKEKAPRVRTEEVDAVADGVEATASPFHLPICTQRDGTALSFWEIQGQVSRGLTGGRVRAQHTRISGEECET